MMRAAKVTMKVTKQSGEEIPTTIVTRSDQFGRFAARSSHYLGSRWSFVAAIAVYRSVGFHRSTFPLLGYLAAGNQYRHYDRHIPDGIPHPEYPEPGCKSHSSETE
jgi:hypothetical protein